MTDPREPKRPDVGAEINLAVTFHDAPLAGVLLWAALVEALKMLEETRADDGWHRDLYDRIMTTYENSMVELTSDGSEDSERVREESEGALRTAAQAVDAAFDHVRLR